MQSKLKELDTNAPDSAKQLYSALAMPLVVTATVEELENNFVSMLAEYCQQHTQSQSALEQSLDRHKESNKSARQTASKEDAKKTSSKKPVDAVGASADKPEAVIPEPIKTESVTQLSNPPSLFKDILWQLFIQQFEYSKWVQSNWQTTILAFQLTRFLGYTALTIRNLNLRLLAILF